MTDFKAVKCPNCGGDGAFTVPLFRADDPTIDLEDEANFRREKCPVCDGSGEISALKAAVYKARGGPAPTKYRPG